MKRTTSLPNEKEVIQVFSLEGLDVPDNGHRPFVEVLLFCFACIVIGWTLFTVVTSAEISSASIDIPEISITSTKKPSVKTNKVSRHFKKEAETMFGVFENLFPEKALRSRPNRKRRRF